MYVCLFYDVISHYHLVEGLSLNIIITTPLVDWLLRLLTYTKKTVIIHFINNNYNKDYKRLYFINLFFHFFFYKYFPCFNENPFYLCNIADCFPFNFTFISFDYVFSFSLYNIRQFIQKSPNIIWESLETELISINFFTCLILSHP